MGTSDDAGEEVVVNVLHDAPDAVLGDGAVDPVYEAKARVLNKAIQDIGMGRYQWQVSCSALVVTVFTRHQLALVLRDGDKPTSWAGIGDVVYG